MKTYQHNYPRLTRILAASLGLSGIACFAAEPAPHTQNAAPDVTGTASNSPNSNWQDQFGTRMERIQQEMDQLVRDSMGSMNATFENFGGPKFDAAATVQDRGNTYVATFSLPKRDLANVKVDVKDGILSVKASAEQTTNAKDTNKNEPETEMLSQYEQLVSLPGPVDASKLSTEKKGDSIIVTIPKKGEENGANNQNSNGNEPNTNNQNNPGQNK